MSKISLSEQCQNIASMEEEKLSAMRDEILKKAEASGMPPRSPSTSVGIMRKDFSRMAEAIAFTAQNIGEEKIPGRLLIEDIRGPLITTERNGDGGALILPPSVIARWEENAQNHIAIADPNPNPNPYEIGLKNCAFFASLDTAVAFSVSDMTPLEVVLACYGFALGKNVSKKFLREAVRYLDIEGAYLHYLDPKK